jgi:hypothetical protein
LRFARHLGPQSWVDGPCNGLVHIEFTAAVMIDYPYCGGSTVTPVPLQRSVDWMLGSSS